MVYYFVCSFFIVPIFPPFSFPSSSPISLLFFKDMQSNTIYSPTPGTSQDVPDVPSGMPLSLGVVGAYYEL